ncbi:Uncharacterised protein [Vibrio cholerae]|nr:Uncharacterised protein [Vibrio cholerae]
MVAGSDFSPSTSLRLPKPITVIGESFVNSLKSDESEICTDLRGKGSRSNSRTAISLPIEAVI